jgi:histidine ammonia-lyase
MVLVMIGKGEAYYNGKLLPGEAAMKKAGIPIIRLKSKEGLALINGTQVMTAVGALAVSDAEQIAKNADISAALTCEALEAIPAAFDNKIQKVRPHKGQTTAAKNLRSLLEGSRIIAKAKHGRVQDAYALRCIPQVHGASRDAIEYVRNVIEVEINSVTDNPILFPDEGEVISGGNFHGQPVAIAMDFLGIAVSELANISERRIERLVNPALSDLPGFLTEKGGLNSGFMISQYVSASLVSENKVLTHPASVDSIPSSANQEDHVSMGTIAARKSREIIENSRNVLAIELLCAAQGIDLRGGEPAEATKVVYNKIRKVVPKLEDDREYRLDIKKVVELIEKETLFEVF